MLKKLNTFKTEYKELYLITMEEKLEKEKAEFKRLSLENKDPSNAMKRISIYEAIIRNMKINLGYNKQISLF